MRVKKLIAQFDCRIALPVDVNDIVKFLQDEQIKDEIFFVGVEIDAEVLRGAIHQFVIPALGYGEPSHCADVYYDEGLTTDWKRLVCCKELLHLLDTEAERVKTSQQIDHQIERMVLPSEFDDFEEDGPRVLTDKVATYFAVAVLFPWAARELLMPAYVAGTLTSEDIARLADIPERYILLAMSNRWPRVHDILLG